MSAKNRRKKKTKGMNIKSLLRKEIINIFENYSGENIIFNDYISYIKEIQERTENFSKVDLRKEMFTWEEINGFYNALDLEFIKLKEKKILSKQIDTSGIMSQTKMAAFYVIVFGI